LEEFAEIVVHHPEQFKPITRKRALFYMNLIKHKSTHLDGGQMPYYQPQDSRTFKRDPNEMRDYLMGEDYINGRKPLPSLSIKPYRPKTIIPGRRIPLRQLPYEGGDMEGGVGGIVPTLCELIYDATHRGIKITRQWFNETVVPKLTESGIYLTNTLLDSWFEWVRNRSRGIESPPPIEEDWEMI
jgi:hypothetical protein